ncbi:MAG: hypothetical protein IJR95_04470 [Lachnospiraceae bacterium]|nr:hypothetical protein [Lachnospiraceae bacterium]
MDDVISRQAAIDAVIKGCQELRGVFSRCEENILALLLAAQVRHGRWEWKEDPYGFFDTIPVCSACGCTTKYRETSAYCPNCGAKMDEEEG